MCDLRLRFCTCDFGLRFVTAIYGCDDWRDLYLRSEDACRRVDDRDSVRGQLQSRHLRRGAHTLGEMDLVIQAADGAIVHLELAVKFYLGRADLHDPLPHCSWLPAIAAPS